MRRPTPEAIRCRELVAACIRAHCAQRSLSMTTVADLAGIAHNHLENVVACRSAATTDWLARMAKVLDLEPRDFLDPTVAARTANPRGRAKVRPAARPTRATRASTPTASEPRKRVRAKQD